MILLQAVSDTLVVKSINATNSGATWTPQLTTAIVASISAVIGALITLFLKSTEFKFQRLEIENQKRLIDDTIKNNQDKLKAEIVKLQQLRKDYELSITKHNYDKLKQVLEFAEANSRETLSDKIKALKNFNEFLAILDKHRPPNEFFDDVDDFNSWLSRSTYKNLTLISNFLNNFDKNFIHVYPEISETIKSMQRRLDNLGYQISDQKSNYTDKNDQDQAVIQFSEQLIGIRNELDNILVEMTKEFKELDKLKKDFIKAQLTKE